ncbi:acetoacetate decarboxylase family protein [Aurantiacibacter flavus]|uniref:Acetoacetate decarboxylase family protein n=1 Tax=Aurantiacibacter flavus TaxID=3145232 RepID=A0ABV0CV14_9SPHN
MPRHFGPAPGPRNLPADQRHRRYEKEVVSYTISARTKAERLGAFLPDGLRLDGEPRIEVCIMSFFKIGWLAGRGYDILMVRIPARWIETETQCAGHFVPVVWENMADPIITGREELGWPKLFADISVSDPSDRSAKVTSSWDGHCFFDFRASGFETLAQAPAPEPMVFEKYIPATGKPDYSDAHYLTITVPDGPEPQVQSTEIGEGQFAFTQASWEQMPTQYPIVNALYDLPLDDFSPVIKTASIFGGDGSAQRKLRM